jgi:hypothetical protein
MPPSASPIPEFETIIDSDGLDVSTISNNVTQGVAIVIPQNARSDSSAGDSTAAILKQEAVSTDSLRRFFGDRNVPRSRGERRTVGAASKKRIAAIIADVARAAPELPPQDLLALLQKAVEWQQKNGRRLGDPFGLDEFLLFCVDERLMLVRWSVVDQYIEWAKQDLLRGFRAFEVEPNTELSESTEKAIPEFRRAVDGFPPYFRTLVTPKEWDRQMQVLKNSLREQIPCRVIMRREELKDEFTTNCTKAYDALAKEARDWVTSTGSSRKEWTPAINAKWAGRFSDVVHFGLVPPAMREEVQEIYDYWCQYTTCRLRFARQPTRQRGRDIAVRFGIIGTFGVVATGLVRLISKGGDDLGEIPAM